MNYLNIIRTSSWRGALDTTVCDKVCQYTGFLHHPPPYYWNIVESGVKHYKPIDILEQSPQWMFHNGIAIW